MIYHDHRNYYDDDNNYDDDDNNYDDDDNNFDDDDGDLHVTVLLLEHGALPLGRQQEGQEPRHSKAGDHHDHDHDHDDNENYDDDRDDKFNFETIKNVIDIYLIYIY